MKLCTTHTGGKIHKYAKGNPCCVNRGKGLFSDYVAVYEFEGDESKITCKKCINKIKKYKPE